LKSLFPGSGNQNAASVIYKIKGSGGDRMKRRKFLQSSIILAGGAVWANGATAEEAKPVTAARLPAWKGFNLLDKFTLRGNKPYVEQDFAWMAAWGFDFVRLPMDYRCWTDSDDPHKLDEQVLADIDQVVEWGKQYNIHVNINLHRAPGYCVNPPKEPLDLWTSQEALDQFCFQWKTFARRYKGIPNDRVSFDLLNEPANIKEETYAHIVRETVNAIRAEDAERLIVADGLRWGRAPVMSLADLKIAQSTRGYDPMRISHHKASWISGSDQWEEPTWPLKLGNQIWDKKRLQEEVIQPFKQLEAKGVGVHVGEWGAHNRTPHDVAVAWMKDFLELWRDAGWGWAVWNLRGSFGIVDSRRDDVKYEDFHGHALDKKMLELLLSFVKK